MVPVMYGRGVGPIAAALGGQGAMAPTSPAPGSAPGSAAQPGVGNSIFGSGISTLQKAAQNGEIDKAAYLANPNYRSAINDYYNIDNSTLDDIGNFFAENLLGFSESKPKPDTTSPNASWGLNPFTAGGLIPGPVGMGFSLASWGNRLAGNPLNIGLGPSVVGTPAPGNFASYLGAPAVGPAVAQLLGLSASQAPATGGPSSGPAGGGGGGLFGGGGKGVGGQGSSGGTLASQGAGLGGPGKKK